MSEHDFTYRGRRVEILAPAKPYLAPFVVIAIDGLQNGILFSSAEIAIREAKAMIDRALDGTAPRRDEDGSLEGGHWRG